MRCFRKLQIDFALTIFSKFSDDENRYNSSIWPSDFDRGLRKEMFGCYKQQNKTNPKSYIKNGEGLTLQHKKLQKTEIQNPENNYLWEEATRKPM